MPEFLAIAFDNPAILAAAGLAVAPIIIHLLMRSKPRLVVFPAMRFVRMTHNASVTRHRLKHLLLMLMRMAAVALVAVVLARPKVESMGNLGLASDEPASVVVVMDTSGSMAYRIAGQPRLEDAKREAIARIKALPAGSEAALVWPDFPEKAAILTKDLDRLAGQIGDLADRKGSDSPADSTVPAMRTCQRARMGGLLTKAYASLAKAANLRREIYLFNDCTRDSWTDVGPGAFVEPLATPESLKLHTDQVAVSLFDVGAAGNQDFLLTDARWPVHVLSTRQAPVITVTVRGGELADKRTIRVSAQIDGQPAGDCDVEFSQKLQTVTQQISNILPQGQTARAGEPAGKTGDFRCVKCGAAVHVTKGERIGPCPACGATEYEQGGLYQAKVGLECKDEITEDNDRYLALEVGSLPQVVMIESERSADRAVSVGDLVAGALAPPGAVSRETAIVNLVRQQASDAAKLVSNDDGKKLLANAHAVILADVRLLGDDVWAALENYVGSGGTLIVLLGPNTEPEKLASAAALAVLPVTKIENRVTLDPPRPAAFPPFDRGISQVLAVYRENDRAPLIDREWVMQYYPVAAKLPAGAQPLVWLSGPNPAPLLIERQVGTGRSLLLTTTGLGSWSQWSQAATMVEVFRSMVLAYPRRQPRAFQYTLDELPSPPMIAPSDYRGGSATVTLPEGRGTVRAPINPATGAVAVPTSYVGHYTVELRSPGRPDETFIYAVNFDPDEYTLARFDPKELAGSFPPGRFRAIGGNGKAEFEKAGAGGPKEIGPMIGLALLLLLIGESFFSNRFYRRPAEAPAAPAPIGRAPSTAEHTGITEAVKV